MKTFATIPRSRKALVLGASLALVTASCLASAAPAPGTHPGGSTKSKIILQHHQHTHAATPGKGNKPAAKSKIILQHH